jgi:hypothetical protein
MKRRTENLIGWLIGIVTLGFYRTMAVGIHHEMTTESCRVVIKASYCEFKEAFEKQQWIWDYRFSGSLFTEDYRSQFHASIIEFDNIGYKLTSYGFIRANCLKNRKISEINNNRVYEFLEVHKNTVLK